jgi:folate-binding protein YgfZ
MAVMTDTRAAERRAVREGALVHRPGLGTLVVTGSERQSWLNGLVTCELKGLAKGQGARGLHCSKPGKIQAELWIVLAEDRLYVGIERKRLAGVHEVFERHLIMEDAEITEASDAHQWLLADGPLAAELGPLALSAGAVASAPIDRTGLGGLAAVAPAQAADAVVAAWRAHPKGAVLLASPEGWNAVRVELLVPEMGVDYDEQSYPQEAALETSTVSFQKGCYLGQEAVFMLEHRGHVKKRLVQLTIEGSDDVGRGAEVLAGGEPTGTITSRAPSLDGSSTLALGYVKYKHAVTGTELTVAGRPAKVTLGRE